MINLFFSFVTIAFLIAPTCISCGPVTTLNSHDRHVLSEMGLLKKTIKVAGAPMKMMKGLLRDNGDLHSIHPNINHRKISPIDKSKRMLNFDKLESDLYAEIGLRRSLSSALVYGIMQDMLQKRLNAIVSESSASIANEYQKAKVQNNAYNQMVKAIVLGKLLLQELVMTELSDEQVLQFYRCIESVISDFDKSINLNDYDILPQVVQHLEAWKKLASNKVEKEATMTELSNLISVLEIALSIGATDYSNYFESVLVLIDDVHHNHVPFYGFRPYTTGAETKLKFSQSLELVNSVFFKMQSVTESVSNGIFREIMDVLAIDQFLEICKSNDKIVHEGKDDLFVLYSSLNMGAAELLRTRDPLQTRFIAYLRQVYLQEMTFPAFPFRKALNFDDSYGKSLEYLKEKLGQKQDLLDLIGDSEHWRNIYLHSEKTKRDRRLLSIFSNMFLNGEDDPCTVEDEKGCRAMNYPTNAGIQKMSQDLAQLTESFLIRGVMDKHFREHFRATNIDYNNDYRILMLCNSEGISRFYQDSLKDFITK